MEPSIVVTGATGFVGQQIVRALAAARRSMRLVVRRGTEHRLRYVPPEAEIVSTEDLFDASTAEMERWFEGAGTVVHAAWYAEPGLYLDSHRNCDCLSGTLRIARQFAGSGGRRFIGIGTCFEYDVTVGTLTIEAPLRPGTLYAACKAATFQVLSHLLPPAGVQLAWCRLFYLYGEGEDERRLFPYLRRQLAAGQAVDLTSGRQVRDYLDVAEAGRRIARLALSDGTGPFNICSGSKTTVRELAERIAAEYGRPDLLRFGARPDNSFDPPYVVGVPNDG